MDDRKLLERAAKAAGIESLGYTPNGLKVPAHHLECGYAYWNPRGDDGDAFRLGHKLGLLSDVTVWPRDIGEARRAIVRAAAELAKEPS